MIRLLDRLAVAIAELRTIGRSARFARQHRPDPVGLDGDA